jgi:hypothetical protein
MLRGSKSTCEGRGRREERGKGRGGRGQRGGGSGGYCQVCVRVHTHSTCSNRESNDLFPPPLPLERRGRGGEGRIRGEGKGEGDGMLVEMALNTQAVRFSPSLLPPPSSIRAPFLHARLHVPRARRKWLVEVLIECEWKGTIVSQEYTLK